MNTEKLREKLVEVFEAKREAFRVYATTRQRGAIATQPQDLSILVDHQLRERNTPRGNFTFVLTERVRVPLRVQWTGSEVVLPDLEGQIAKHALAIERRGLARLN